MRKLSIVWLILLCACTGEISRTPELENDRIKACFDSSTGALIRLIDKSTGWEIVERAPLGQSFELLLPLTDKDIRYNVVNGMEQKKPVIKRENNRITFTWRGMQTGRMKHKADITFTGTVSLSDHGLEYGGEIINNSNYPIEYVSWPCLGEVTVPDKNQPFYRETRSDSRQLYPNFYNEPGYWGVDYPTSTCILPEKSFVLAHNEKQGFIVTSDETFPTNLLIVSFELVPGFGSRYTNPQTDTIDGQSVRIQFKANRVIYNQPGEKTVLHPVRLSVYKGPWQSGIDIYKDELKKRSSVSPEWIKQPLVWQTVSANNGEKLIREAKESVKAGVDVLQLSDWYRRTENGIEEAAGMVEAVKECKKMGLRVVLETNWTAVNPREETYREEYYPYLMTDPFGIPYDRCYLCPSAENVQKKVSEVWSKLEIFKAADGFINADNNHKNNLFLCFSAKHGHRPGEPTANGTMALDKLMCDKIKGSGGGEKTALGYGFLDNVPFYDGYRITTVSRNFAKHRYMHPDIPVMATIDVKNARRDINNALLYRFNITHDPNFYDSRLNDYPQIISYANKVKSLWKRYPESLWDVTPVSGEATVEGDNLDRSIYTNNKGKKSVVVVNTSTENTSSVKIKIDGASTIVFATPENTALTVYTGNIELRPQSAIVFFEQ